MMQLAVTITVQAAYPQEAFPETLAAALIEEIRAHLLAYGLKDVVIDVGLETVIGRPAV
jgi:hypothetical protein